MRRLNDQAMKMLIAIGILTVVGLLIWEQKPSRKHLELLEMIPIGSPVKEIVPLLSEDSVWGSSVFRRSTRDGKSHVENLGSLRIAWAKNTDFKRFTGDIVLSVEGRLNNTSVWFTFENGVLVKKDWGFLPG